MHCISQRCRPERDLMNSAMPVSAVSGTSADEVSHLAGGTVQCAKDDVLKCTGISHIDRSENFFLPAGITWWDACGTAPHHRNDTTRFLPRRRHTTAIEAQRNIASDIMRPAGLVIQRQPHAIDSCLRDDRDGIGTAMDHRFNRGATIDPESASRCSSVGGQSIKRM